MLRLSTSRLFPGTQGPDVAELHRALAALGRSVTAAEREPRVFGPETADAIRALQEELGIAATGVVDESTVRLVNARLAKRPAEERVVRGTVRLSTGAPASANSFLVRVWQKDRQRESLLGQARPDAEGAYEVRYTLSAEAQGRRRVDLRVEVARADATGTFTTLETQPDGRAVLQQADLLEVLDFVVVQDNQQPASEYDQLTGDLKPVVGGSSGLDRLDGPQLHLLAGEIGHPVDHLVALAGARRLAQQSSVPEPVFYAALRNGYVADLHTLLSTSATARAGALERAVNERIVPGTVNGRPTVEFATDLRSQAVALAAEPPRPGAASVRDLARLVLTDPEADDLLTRFAHADQADTFWTAVAGHPKAADFRQVVELGSLTHNHLPLVNALRALQLPDTRALAGLPMAQWDQLLAQSGVPPDTPGATETEKAAAYRQAVLDRVEGAHFQSFFAARLRDAGGEPQVAQFLESQGDFDLRKTHLAGFLAAHGGAGLDAPGVARLQTYQRLARLTTSAAETLAVAAHVRSAGQIAAMGRSAFVERVAAVGETRAAAIYDRARQSHAASLALWSEHAADFNRTGLAALPSIDREALMAAAVGDGQQPGAIPDWETLFGSFELCACAACQSVQSPAAYFVDLLQFLDARGVQPQLLARRPDLADIELSCENSHTVLPYVDLVNEVLEDRVAPPAAFTATPLMGIAAADLAGPMAGDALRNAFAPPLAPAAGVDVLEEGRSWRVTDAQFAYEVREEAGVFTAVARSRQTTGSSEERRAYPQYRNAAAYDALKDAAFPWTLPFDRDAEEAAVYLGHLGVDRHALIEALRAPGGAPAASPISRRLAAARLGLTARDREIVVGETATDRPAFWGDEPTAHVRDLLDGTGLTFAQLDAVLATWFVNPSGALRIDAPDSCDLTAMTVAALDDTALSRLHRFVRLWRRLEWQIDELDKVLRALASDPSTPALDDATLVTIAQVVELRRQLRLPVLEVLALWHPLDTAGPASLYRRLFQDEKFSKATREAFRLGPDGQDLHDAAGRLADHAATLQAVLRLGAVAFERMAALTDGALTRANLSFLLRRARLMQALTLTADELLAATALTGVDPFAAPASTARFVELVEEVKASGFRWAELDYLLRHRYEPPAPFVPSDQSLAATLGGLRSGLAQLDTSVPAGDRRNLVIDRLTSVLAVPAAATRALLDGGPDMDVLIGVQHVAGDVLDRSNAGPQFDALQRLHAIAGVVVRLKLPADQWARLVGADAWVNLLEIPPAAVDPSPIAVETWRRMAQAPQLRRALAVEDGALEAVLEAQHHVATATDASARAVAKTALVTTLGQWLGWQAADIEALIGPGADPGNGGLFDAQIPDAFRGPGLLLHLARAVGLARKLGVSVAMANAWCEETLDADAARAIRAAAMARHDEPSWLKVAKPLQDRLRNAQRSALVAYLAARPLLWRPGPDTSRAEPNDLFAHFLMDVEMDACQLTSRLTQATGSVQLFAQRCLMGLEGVAVDDEAWLQWRWMKNYRVWEANRKVWLYPENWIEPELRDDKTPFFRDLETELLQEEITDQSAQAAVERYLTKLDQVSRLDICGLYEDDEAHVLHVVGRTFNPPYVYFRREVPVTVGEQRRFGRWTPWEPVELDLEGDHLIPVVRNRKLTLFWPIFTRKQESKPVTMPAAGATLQPGGEYWELQMAWSELQHGRWSARTLSPAVAVRAYRSGNVLFGPPMERRIIINPNPHVMFICADPMGCHQPEVDDEVEPPEPGGSSGSGGNPVPVALVLLDRRLFSFKAFAAGDSVVVRGYLSLEYMGGDAEAAAAFGQFHVEGCRSHVSVQPRSSIATRTLPLAPAGCMFDGMGFKQRSGGFRMMDGNLPVSVDHTAGVAVPGSRPGTLNDGLPTVAAMKDARVDIDVFRRTPTPYRVQAPHQDLQFKGDRPFVFQDHSRALIATSTGHSGTRPDLFEWTVGDLSAIWTADYFGARAEQDSGAAPPATEGSMVVLERRGDGRRVARRIVAPDLARTVARRTGMPRFWTTRRYAFAPFAHPFTCRFLSTLERDGLRGLLSLEAQAETDAFLDDYEPVPERIEAGEPPLDEVDFGRNGAYEIYNWELFFHIPLFIADRLTKNQRFEEAQRWYHFIFDPTGSAGGDAPQRYWRTLPFNRRLQGGAGSESYEAQSVQAIERALAKGASPDWTAAVEEWRAKPFNPHAVARVRTTAYQKTVVMKYVDNLLAWGDQLFRRDTLESVNEATQLFVLAAEILGRRPEPIARRRARRLETFRSLSADDRIGPLGNVEQLVPADTEAAPVEGTEIPDLPSPASLYFCVPENARLLGYWPLVADRLFKLRHCMDIEGRVRELPLFALPIDPGLLVRAQAAGLSAGDILDALGDTASSYRFTVMLQKANELVGETRTLAAGFQSALEKRDAEALALLRSRQDVTLLAAVRDVRQKQVTEAREQVSALAENRRSAETRKQYYESREFQNAQESASLALASASMGLMGKAAIYRYLAGKFAALGALKIGAPPTSGLEIGPNYIAESLKADAGAFEALGQQKSGESQRAGRSGEFTRRQDEWTQQAQLADIEIKGIDRQLAAAEIRLAVAERELHNHELQTEQARDADRFMREKFTNAELFGWMVGQTAALYFQTYQLAFDTARRAEQCLRRELGEPDGADADRIRFGHWDSLRKGLLAADRLSHDLKRLEMAYLEKSTREFELTRHVSLATLDPMAFIALKEIGACELRVPEALFDFDTPGHYGRRLKTVAVTIPCVTGPYTGVHCTLRLMSHEIRWDPTAPATADGYARQVPDDARFIVDRVRREAIVTSSGQNDSGVFETDLGDPRYLPFEGAGAVGTWRLELPTGFEMFDYESIADVILHLRYTAREGGPALADRAAEAARLLAARGVIAEGPAAGESRPLARLVSLRHEFPSEWHRFVSATEPGPHALTIDVAKARFPYFVQRLDVTIRRAVVLARSRANEAVDVGIAPGPVVTPGAGSPWEGQAAPGSWTLSTTVPPGNLRDVFVVLEYGAA